MTVKKKLGLVLLVAAGVAGSIRADELNIANKARGVCETLQAVENYHERMVVVRGRLHISWRHGVRFLREVGGLTEDGRCPGFAGTKADWPPEISVLWPTEGPADGPVSFRAERGKIWQQLLYHLKGSEVGISAVVVIEGELRSRPGIKIVRRDGGWCEGNGYGRNGDFPAELVIKRIVKIERPIRVN